MIQADVHQFDIKAALIGFADRQQNGFVSVSECALTDQMNSNVACTSNGRPSPDRAIKSVMRVVSQAVTASTSHSGLSF